MAPGKSLGKGVGTTVHRHPLLPGVAAGLEALARSQPAVLGPVVVAWARYRQAHLRKACYIPTELHNRTTTRDNPHNPKGSDPSGSRPGCRRRSGGLGLHPAKVSVDHVVRRANAPRK